MGGQRSSARAQYSDDSDSETEEYKELEPNINPVTGKWRLVVAHIALLTNAFYANQFLG